MEEMRCLCIFTHFGAGCMSLEGGGGWSGGFGWDGIGLVMESRPGDWWNFRLGLSGLFCLL